MSIRHLITRDVELVADQPFHRLVAGAQLAVADGATHLWITGPGAAPVAARLVRLVSGVTVGVELLGEAAAAARDAVAFAGVAGGRASVLVRDARLRAEIELAVVADLDRGPRSLPAHFGGDAFAATIRLPWPVEIDVVAEVAGITHDALLAA